MTSPESRQNLAAIILAAGKGTRMKSQLPKVLQPVGGRPMLHHALSLVGRMSVEKCAAVVGADSERVEAAARAFRPDIQLAVQDPPLGTAHAVLAAKDQMQDFRGEVIILYADTPLIQPHTLQRMSEARRAGADIVVLGFEAEDPGRYGRLIVDNEGTLTAIVEAKEATPEQLAVRLCNSGVILADTQVLFDLLSKVSNDNAKGEYYLTDIVAIGRSEERNAVVVVCEEDEVLGVDSKVGLAKAERIFQDRRRRDAMEAGATLLDPSTVYFSYDTEIGSDVAIGQNVVFGPGAVIGNHVTIHPFSHIEGAHVSDHASIGPFARLRPGARIGDKAKVGNFVEIKKAVVEEGAKINHLTYIGDAFIGASANIGAGTITCNYDGYDKYETRIGRGAFIGSNSSLVAPVSIADGAYIGSGSVITKDVEQDALAFERNQQAKREGWAARFRDRKERQKAKKDSSSN